MGAWDHGETQLWLLDPVAGWSPSRRPLARLQQAPRHHLADPALATRLLNLTERTLLTPAGAAMIGPLFESLVTLTVRVCAQAAEARIGHLRTTNGDHEVDLVVEGSDAFGAWKASARRSGWRTRYNVRASGHGACPW